MEETTIQTPKKIWGMDIPTYCMVMHLSQFCYFLIPFAGVIVPIIMWAANKQEDPIIDKHGKVIVNWALSALIYGAIFFILMFIVIGFFLLMGLGIVCVIFTIIGAVKAMNGEVWKYPFSIEFLKLEEPTKTA